MIDTSFDAMICKQLGFKEKKELDQLISSFGHVFVTHRKRPGRCLVDEPHRIQAGDSPSKRTRPNAYLFIGNWESQDS